MSRNSFGKWYDANGQEHNKQRRERYNADEAHRLKVLERARKYKLSEAYKKKKWLEAHQTEINGHTVLAYSISEAADMIGRDVANIRYWESKGYILDAKRGGSRRRYTQDNIRLLHRLNDALKSGRRGVRLQSIVRTIKKRWR